MSKHDLAEGVEITKSNATLAAEAEIAREKGEPDPEEIVGRPLFVAGADNSAFVGVEEQYASYADVTGQPFRADGGVEAELEARFLGAYAPTTGASAADEPAKSDEPPAEAPAAKD